MTKRSLILGDALAPVNLERFNKSTVLETYLELSINGIRCTLSSKDSGHRWFLAAKTLLTKFIDETHDEETIKSVLANIAKKVGTKFDDQKAGGAHHTINLAEGWYWHWEESDKGIVRHIRIIDELRLAANWGIIQIDYERIKD